MHGRELARNQDAHQWLPNAQTAGTAILSADGALRAQGDLGDSLVAAFNSDSPAEARQQLVAMVSKLGDPYTRLIPARSPLF